MDGFNTGSGSALRRVVLCVAASWLLLCAAPAPAAEKPDVVVLVHPSVPQWSELLKESQANLSPIHVVMTQTKRGVQTPANVRFELGTSLTHVKDWRYGFILSPPSPRPVARNELPPNWSRISLDYSLYFNSEKKGATLVLKHTIVGDLPARGADQFIKTLFANQIGPDLSASFAPKVYALGNGMPMLSPNGHAAASAFPVRLVKAANGDVAEFPLDNRLEFPVNVSLEVGPLVKNVRGQWIWGGDRTVHIFAPPRPTTLQPGEKKTATVEVAALKGVAPGGAVPTVSIFDKEVAPYVR